MNLGQKMFLVKKTLGQENFWDKETSTKTTRNLVGIVEVHRKVKKKRRPKKT